MGGIVAAIKAWAAVAGVLILVAFAAGAAFMWWLG